MENKELIPFSKELWETGEYEAVTFDNYLAKIFNIDEEGVYGKLFDKAYGWKPNGDVYDGENSENNLMLRKKTKKVWIAVFTNCCFPTEEECKLDYKDYPTFIKAIEVEI